MLLRARQESYSCDLFKEYNDNPGSHNLTDSKEEREFWSEIEDKRLKSLVEILGENSWKEVADYFKSKSANQCRNRWYRVSNPVKLTLSYIRSPKLSLNRNRQPGLDTFVVYDKKRLFTKEENCKINPKDKCKFCNLGKPESWEQEDEKLVELVQKYGSNNWDLVAEHMEGRNGYQCKQRWKNYSDPALKTGTPFTLDEERLLIHCHELWGDQWSKLATVIPGRSAASIRYHWKLNLEKKNDASGGLKVQESAIQSDAQQEKKDDASVGFKNPNIQESAIQSDAQQEKKDDASVGFKNPNIQESAIQSDAQQEKKDDASVGFKNPNIQKSAVQSVAQQGKKDDASVGFKNPNIQKSAVQSVAQQGKKDDASVGFKNPNIQKSAIHSDVQQEKKDDSSVGFKNPKVQEKRKHTPEESTQSKRSSSRKGIPELAFSEEEFQTAALQSSDNDSFHAWSALTDGWSPDEDKRLKSLAETFGHNNWKRVAAYFPNKKEVQCYQRYRFVLNFDGIFNGRFSEQEDKKLIELVQKYGAHSGRSWDCIASYLQGRTNVQCRNRWYAITDVPSKNAPWTQKERQLIIRYQKRWKNNWSKITEKLPGRTMRMVKRYWFNCLKREKAVSRGLRKKERQEKKIANATHSKSRSKVAGGYSCSNDSSRKDTSSEGPPELEDMRNLYVFPVKEELVTSAEEFQMIPVSNTESPFSNGLQPQIVSVASLQVKEESQLSVDLLPENIHASPFSDGVNWNVSSLCTPVYGNQTSFTNIPNENSVATQDHIGCILSGTDTLKEHQISHDSLSESRPLYERNAQRKSVKSSCAKPEESLLSAMKIIYFQAKEDLATKKFSALEDLMTDLSCSSLAALNVSSNMYSESCDYLEDIEAALASVIQEEIVKLINEARWYSIIIDECSDVSMELSLIIYVQFAQKGKMVTHFLCIAEIEEVSAAKIFVCVEKTLLKLGIDFSKCSSLAIDGPSVAKGVRAEVAALFRKHNPHLLSLHCVAHRISLALTQAAEEFPYLIKYRDVLKRAHSYFEKSPAKTNRLHQIQCVLSQTNKKGLKLSAIRGLSLGNSVLNVDTFWSALISVFSEDNCPESQGLLKQMKSYMFLATTAMLNDVVFCVNKLQMAFQKKNLDFEFAQACVIACLGNLKSMRNKTGTYFMDFQDKTPKDAGETFMYDAHVVTDSIEQRNKFDVLMDSFLVSMIGHIEDRLGDMDKIEMFNIFLPSNLPDTPSEFEVYGMQEIFKIFQLFCSFVDYGESEWLSEWAFFKVIMQKRLKNMTIQEVLEFIVINDMSQEYPIMCSVIEYALTIPLHTADCERGFSALNHMKTSSKNRKNLHQVNQRLTIKIEGPDRQKFDFYQALEKWANIRKN